jgi:outer membrane protein OmpA-like peptidoglycan-associated protein
MKPCAFAVVLFCLISPLSVVPTVGHSAEIPIVKSSSSIRDELLCGGPCTRGIKAQARPVALRIQFELNSSVIRPEAYGQLDELWAALSDELLREQKIEISGHTDITGSDAHNLRLSEQRASAVRSYLAAKGAPLDVALLSVVGHGRLKLLPDVSPSDPLHRRVEIRVLKDSTSAQESVP